MCKVNKAFRCLLQFVITLCFVELSRRKTFSGCDTTLVDLRDPRRWEGGTDLSQSSGELFNNARERGRVRGGGGQGARGGRDWKLMRKFKQISVGSDTRGVSVR